MLAELDANSIPTRSRIEKQLERGRTTGKYQLSTLNLAKARSHVHVRTNSPVCFNAMQCLDRNLYYHCSHAFIQLQVPEELYSSKQLANVNFWEVGSM